MSEFDDLYIDERPRRMVPDGSHSLNKFTSKDGTVIILRCKNPECNWWSSDFISNRESLERRGWAHISRPDLRIIGSSDVMAATRRALAEERFAKGRLGD